MRMAKNCHFVWHVHFLNVLAGYHCDQLFGFNCLCCGLSAHNVHGGRIPGYSGMAEEILWPILPANPVLSHANAYGGCYTFPTARIYCSMVSRAERVHDAQQQG